MCAVLGMEPRPLCLLGNPLSKDPNKDLPLPWEASFPLTRKNNCQFSQRKSSTSTETLKILIELRIAVCIVKLLALMEPCGQGVSCWRFRNSKVNKRTTGNCDSADRKILNLLIFIRKWKKSVIFSPPLVQLQGKVLLSWFLSNFMDLFSSDGYWGWIAATTYLSVLKRVRKQYLGSSRERAL